MRELTEHHRTLLTELDRLGDQGALTCRLAGWEPTPWATNRMRTLARRGLVRRHESNAERWYITPAGRTALNPPAREGEGDQP
ncbi:hypothetical protein [Methylobacterium sp. J-092]|uniref:hypothetical protein n=1 Tax=Methylobacterium sp. J-092 TaxID=2836667 RepID=UPI001FBB4607|nr:hypothetical protein [Methylobacterium sp. J-092]MCJ2009906.1 hypothetical protein [Methylobacterium sp. J-092]